MKFNTYTILYFGICLVFVFAHSFSLNIDELKPLNYEVDIDTVPLKKAETYPHSVYMTSVYGQQYQCLLPQIDDEDILEKEALDEKNSDIKELLNPMKTTSCLLKGKDWWTYEFCFGHYIKQFHIEDGQILGPVITLGLYDSDYDWNNNETTEEKFKHVKQKYHSQYYVNGTKCDLTGEPRNAEIRIYCEEDAGDYIQRVDEPGTCSYIITIHTSRLCSHPQLKPVPSKKAHAIPCHPLLNEEQYSSYLQKLNEEKELADKKLSQWLRNQQERLKFIKDGKLRHIEGENVLMSSTELLKDIEVPSDAPTESNEFLAKIEGGEQFANRDVNSARNKESAVETFSVQDYRRVLEQLKPYLTPEKFAKMRSSIEKYVESASINENHKEKHSEEDIDPSIVKVQLNLLSQLSTTDLNSKDTPKELGGVSSDPDISSVEVKEDPSIEQVEYEVLNNEEQSRSEDGSKEYLLPDKDTNDDSDELQVRIRRLDRKPSDPNGKLYEMDFLHRKKLEQAVKEKLEKAGLDTLGRRIEVKIITTGYYNNEDGKEFQFLSEEETNQFQNMIMALLTGQQEAVQEVERHKKLEENYKFTWEVNDDEVDD